MLHSPLTRFIFHKHDDAILKYEYDDNLKIEPVHYLPIIPMVLVNGADGIGTGWMTKIPNYNPREIIENLYRMIEGAEPKPMVIHSFVISYPSFFFPILRPGCCTWLNFCLSSGAFLQKLQRNHRKLR